MFTRTLQHFTKSQTFHDTKAYTNLHVVTRCEVFVHSTIIMYGASHVYYIFTFTSVIHVGADKPNLLYLNRHVRDSIATKWHDVGIELLEQGSEKALQLITANKPGNGNVSACCAEMLQLWLSRQPNATWNQLICALRSPGIQLNDVAMEIEGRLLPSSEGDYLTSYIAS